ncbi:FtsX-like permease family protein [Demequina capsici]|uniref:FtsX-like permease family protein n=1 Tax=Demequina capsici TaxID=3075620 RepID=A0AA96F9V4_9MICO|nr:FtsX-like permease family protein [Demequina sp. OYTSA14]WNM24746.1 FtsX-like permease family protein [Demequina sp. OYTSA14]
MIRQLVGEQLRSHRAYVIWTTALLTLAIGFASFAAFVGVQQGAVVQHVASAHGMDGGWSTAVAVSQGDPSVDCACLTVTPAELNALLGEANAEGAGIAAITDTGLTVIPAGVSPADWLDQAETHPVYGASATTGEVDWPTLLESGDAPGAGQVAVDAQWAADNGVAAGDPITIATFGIDRDFVSLGTVTVSGLLRTTASGGYAAWQEQTLIGWDSVFDLEQRAYAARGADPDESLDMVMLSAQRETPSLAALDADQVGHDYFLEHGGPNSYLLIAAGVLVIGLIGMAFAVGRAQAQARTQWVATARVLGARRSTVVAATAVETAAVGLVAGVLGAGIAYAALAVEWAGVLSANPDALIPSSVAVAAWYPLGMVAVSLVIAAIMGAVPAFWAARVTPAAALKPETPATSAQFSRTVRVWPLLVVWGLAFVVVLMMVQGLPGDTGWGVALHYSSAYGLLRWIVLLAAGVTSLAVIVEIMRRVVRATAVALERSSTPWMLTAGAALRGRPALAAAPAAVLALASGVAMYTVVAIALTAWSETWEPYVSVDPQWEALGPFAFGAGRFAGYRTTLVEVTIVGFLLVLVALAAFTAGRHATRAESTAHAALGLDARAARLASAVQFGLPLALGVVVGAALGSATACLMFSTESRTYSESGDVTSQTMLGPTWAFTHLSHTVVPGLAALLVLLGSVAVGATAAALTTRNPARLVERIAA